MVRWWKSEHNYHLSWFDQHCGIGNLNESYHTYTLQVHFRRSFVSPLLPSGSLIQTKNWEYCNISSYYIINTYQYLPIPSNTYNERVAFRLHFDISWDIDLTKTNRTNFAIDAIVAPPPVLLYALHRRDQPRCFDTKYKTHLQNVSIGIHGIRTLPENNIL